MWLAWIVRGRVSPTVRTPHQPLIDTIAFKPSGNSVSAVPVV